MEYAVRVTEDFERWAKSLRDPKAKSAVFVRVARLRVGNMGDCKSVGDGVSELRVHVGKGYRVYFTVRGKEIVFLLTGGHKDTQRKDIARAKEIARALND